MTIQELQDICLKMKLKRAILTQLIDHIDKEFLPTLDAKPNKILLTDDKIAVPKELFEETAAEITNWMKEILKKEQEFLSTAVVFVPPKSEEQVAPAEEKAS